MIEFPVDKESKRLGKAPTHVCPRCGEWWDVERAGSDEWFVTAHDNENGLMAKVWTEASDLPVCPVDAASLHDFCIVD